VSTAIEFKMLSVNDPEEKGIVFDVAVIVTVFGDGTTVGGEYSPEAEIVPTVLLPPRLPFTDQVTAEVSTLSTRAENCIVDPIRTELTPVIEICDVADDVIPDVLEIFTLLLQLSITRQMLAINAKKAVYRKRISMCLPSPLLLSREAIRAQTGTQVSYQIVREGQLPIDHLLENQRTHQFSVCGKQI